MSTVAPPDDPKYNWANPKRVGPGAWYMFMLMASHAKSASERLWVCTQIRLFCDSFKCGECNGHCHKYIEANPPEVCIETEYGLFDWVVTFMNAVETRLGKQTYDRDILFQTFTIPEFKFCDKDCGGTKPPPTAAATHSKKEAYLQKQRQEAKSKRGNAYTSTRASTTFVSNNRSSGFYLKR